MSDPGNNQGNNADNKKGKGFKAFWNRMWRQPNRWWLLGIPLGGLVAFIAGILFLGTFNTVLSHTNTEEFCISCHEMESTVYQEYKETVHYKNKYGVRAICSDCHVPHAFGPKVLKKIEATKELYHAILGTIDTPEKFEAHRMDMAERVWEFMEETDSRECRSCHSYAAMDLEEQGRSASRKHSPEWLEKSGDTCIDCHKGIAHKLPEGY